MKEAVRGQLRQIIFGAEDGLVSIFGLAMGVVATELSNQFIGIAGLAGALAGAISMAAGTFLSAKSANEILDVEGSGRNLDEHALEVLNICKEKGMTEGEMAKIEALIKRELGEEMSLRRRVPLTDALWMFFPYILVSAAPVLPFFLTSDRRAAVWLSIFLTFALLFTVGAYKTRYTKRSMWKAGFEMFIVGTLAAVLSYLVVLPFSKHMLIY